MVLLEPDKFLAELERCYTSAKAHKKGSLFMCLKKYDGRTKPLPRNPADRQPGTENLCLVRVTYGNKKFSTHVDSKDLQKFQASFSALMRSGMSNIGKKSEVAVSKSASSTSTGAGKKQAKS